MMLPSVKNQVITNQRGLSALTMVLLLLAFGVFMLRGLHQQLNNNLHNVASEALAIRQFSAALSAQAWGMHRRWTPAADWQCQQDNQRRWRACLRQDTLNQRTNGIVLAAQALPEDTQQPITVWRYGQQAGDKLQFLPHSWSDFCPLAEANLCVLP